MNLCFCPFQLSFVFHFDAKDSDFCPNFQKVEIKVFDVRTGRMMRDFKGSADEFSIGGPGGVAGASWPVFR